MLTIENLDTQVTHSMELVNKEYFINKWNLPEEIYKEEDVTQLINKGKILKNIKIGNTYVLLEASIENTSIHYVAFDKNNKVIEEIIHSI